MFIKVCPDLGFNDQAVAHWTYELVAPPDPPVTQSARGRAPHDRTPAREEEDKAGPGREGSAREAVPTPQEDPPVPQPTPTLTLYFIGGGEPVVLEDEDATKVANYFGVPSSYMTVL